ncbi:NYN domain-containing protein [Corynebacterium uberis]|uniref:NYN domain-containing protein n=1 Tax=Corynebacterium TaxID=1716 RepID=UPI001D0B56C6|nr:MULTISPECIES: NYN domain-containing protein [Corynebacterium]MCZ9310344.1 NYN domain-containing protein [Corynebacterium sp. c6VSa_13]UDL73369.1 NYN domain-containing protein [Corynebacterium uberis]UDL75753.1 NYN domain-containing protein [Corynebacterium uberis]UDL77965.1 NYN domain-containing protein [Corynebacterium uberis]UDL80248.1 NYN domain-containing protein [Corynebacterium uberis]
MLERTLVFVDTSYLLASFYNSWETGARAQLEIDLPEVVSVLGSMIENQLDQPIHRQLWYDGIPDSGPHRYQRALRTCDGVQLRAGQLIEWGERRTQKAVDTRLVADMVISACQHQCSDMVLVSGDADMIPGVDEATKAGARVHLYGFGWDSMSSALRHACDTTTILDPREDFADSMQLEILEGPLPPIIRNKPLGDTEPPEEPGRALIPENATYGYSKTGTHGGHGNHAGPGQGGNPHADQRATEDAQSTQTHDAPETAASTEAPTAADTASAAPATPGTSDAPAASEPEALRTPTADDAESPAPSASSAPATSAQDSRAQAQQEATRTEHLDQAGAGSRKPETARSIGDSPADADDFEDIEDLATAPTHRTKTGHKASGRGNRPAPKPSMMAPKRRLRSRYVPLPNEVWASAGYQTPYDVGQQYATWWYENAATTEQRDQAHLLSGGGLPPDVDRPLLQFACETLHEYTLSETQRVNLRDGFHAGIRGVLINIRNRD